MTANVKVTFTCSGCGREVEDEFGSTTIVTPLGWWQTASGQLLCPECVLALEELPRLL